MDNRNLIGNINVTGQGSIDVYLNGGDPAHVYIATNNPAEGHDGKNTGDDKYHHRYSAYETYGFMGKLRLHLEKQGFDVTRTDTGGNFKPEIFEVTKRDDAMDLADFANKVLFEVGKFQSQLREASRKKG